MINPDVFDVFRDMIVTIFEEAGWTILDLSDFYLGMSDWLYAKDPWHVKIDRMRVYTYQLRWDHLITDISAFQRFCLADSTMHMLWEELGSMLDDVRLPSASSSAGVPRIVETPTNQVVSTKCECPATITTQLLATGITLIDIKDVTFCWGSEPSEWGDFHIAMSISDHTVALVKVSFP